MKKIEISTKRLAISKANGQMLVAVSAAAFISVFCLMASNTVWGTVKYQAKVISVKQKANKQLKDNVAAFDGLRRSFAAFDSASNNVIGGLKNGNQDNDGSNSKIILDSLPSVYDFPALASSLEKIMGDRGLKVGSITGTDDQLAQQKNTSSPEPQPTPMPFTVNVTGANYTSLQDFINALQKSIRPIAIDSLDISGGSSDMSATVTAHTYYEPGKSVNIKKQVVK
jgi:Tfp pilus assembly protein PilO